MAKDLYAPFSSATRAADPTALVTLLAATAALRPANGKKVGGDGK